MADHKANAQQMAQAGEYLITVAEKINSTLASIDNRLKAIKNAAGKLDSYNGQPVEGREDIAEYKSSYNYTNKVGEDEYVYRVTTYKVFDEVWNISGQSVAQMEAEKLEQQMNANIKKIISTLQKYSIRVKGNAQALALKQKKIDAILNDKEFKEYFQKNIFYNKYDAARGNNGANVTSKTSPYWIDENLKFVKQDNGAWLITKNGVAMGFTTGGAVAAYQKYRASKDIKENKKSSPVTLSEAEYKKLQEARKREAEGRKKQQEAEARKIRAKDKAGAAATTAGTVAAGGITLGKNVKVPETELGKEWREKGLISDKKQVDYFNLNKNKNANTNANKAKKSTTYSKDDYLIKKAEQEQKAKANKQSSSGKLSDKQMKELQEARRKEAEGRKKQQAASSAGIESSGAKEKIENLRRKTPSETKAGVHNTSKTTNNIPNSTFAAKPIPSSEKAVAWAKKIANNDSIGYSQAVREGSSYDCSSLIINAYEKAGIPVKAAGATNTGNMIKAFTKTGKFEYVPGNPNVNNLKPGDIVITPGSHTEMYVGKGKLLGAHDNFDGSVGDSSGKEINVADYYGTWSGYLKYKGN
ncbi:MAG: C40 family peptidase [Bacilli bacterium]|nr:C40 family peptidase [Bacilli bacterium]